MNWTAIIITVIICLTITTIGVIIESIFEKKYSKKSFFEEWFNKDDNKKGENE